MSVAYHAIGGVDERGGRVYVIPAKNTEVGRAMPWRTWSIKCDLECALVYDRQQFRRVRLVPAQYCATGLNQTMLEQEQLAHPCGLPKPTKLIEPANANW